MGTETVIERDFGFVWSQEKNWIGGSDQIGRPIDWKPIAVEEWGG